VLGKTLLEHDLALRDFFRKLLPLLQPPPEPPKRRIALRLTTGGFSKKSIPATRLIAIGRDFKLKP
jgi:hypothetical protein